MSLYRNKYRRESTRLQGWNYSDPGYYYVTICVNDRCPVLGHVKNGRMQLSKFGKIVAEEWRKIGSIYNNVKLDEWVVMPNHFHGILVITDDESVANGPVATIHELSLQNPTQHTVETIHELSLREPPPPPRVVRINRRRMLLSKIIGRFKMRSAKRINVKRKCPGKPFWQSSFYDHIIKDNLSLERIRAYIRNNPKAWNRDRNNAEDIFM